MLRADITTDTSYSTGATPDPWMPASWQAGSGGRRLAVHNTKDEDIQETCTPTDGLFKTLPIRRLRDVFPAPFEVCELSPGRTATNPNPRGRRGPIAVQNVKRRRCF